MLSVVQRGDSPEYQRLAERLDTADEEVAVTIVSNEEQMRGWLALIARAKSSLQQVKAYSKFHQLLDDFTSRPVIDFDETCAVKFDLLVHARTRVGTMDLTIAATDLPRCPPAVAQPGGFPQSRWTSCRGLDAVRAR